MVARAFFSQHMAQLAVFCDTHASSFRPLYIQRDALLLSCAAGQLKPEIQDAIKNGVEDLFHIENAILASVQFSALPGAE